MKDANGKWPLCSCFRSKLAKFNSKCVFCLFSFSPPFSDWGPWTQTWKCRSSFPLLHIQPLQRELQITTSWSQQNHMTCKKEGWDSKVTKAKASHHLAYVQNLWQRAALMDCVHYGWSPVTEHTLISDCSSQSRLSRSCCHCLHEH